MWCSFGINWRRFDNSSASEGTQMSHQPGCVSLCAQNWQIPCQVTRARPRNHPGQETGETGAPGHQPGSNIYNDSSINNYPSNYKHHEPQTDRAAWCLLTGNKSGFCDDYLFCCILCGHCGHIMMGGMRVQAAVKGLHWRGRAAVMHPWGRIKLSSATKTSS